MEQSLQDFNLGYNAGYRDAFDKIRRRSKGLKVENRCLLIPIEALEDVDYADFEKAEIDFSVLRKEFVRWSKVAESNNKSMYIAVRGDGTSHSITMVDGQISTRCMLADHVEVNV